MNIALYCLNESENLKESFPFVSIFLSFLFTTILMVTLSACNPRETSREINLISQCDKFNITWLARESADWDWTPRKIPPSHGTNTVF